MLWRQSLIIGSLILAAVILELTLLSRLGLPGATPDLVVVTIVAIAFAMGPTQGAVAGFTAGILIDLAPPSDTLLGVNALVYVAIGFVTGIAIDPRDRTVPIMIGVVGLVGGGGRRRDRRPRHAAGQRPDRLGRDAGHRADDGAVRGGDGAPGHPGRGLARAPGDSRGARRLSPWEYSPHKPHSGASGTGRPSCTSYRHT